MTREIGLAVKTGLGVGPRSNFIMIVGEVIILEVGRLVIPSSFIFVNFYYTGEFTYVWVRNLFGAFVRESGILGIARLDLLV